MAEADEIAERKRLAKVMDEIIERGRTRAATVDHADTDEIDYDEHGLPR
ncbi:hypothetical protein ARHIZOSPH14_31810 [Agromyces rhizosphaerae]|uniref:Uncharacterized protein n=1 Tax=Agromyces rhizosphaerae TaxID=88374 RepID=A0A9W6CY77_9MICO|nr:hypothetical protein [Agromyces rhizosphaerae]GLI28939.1 hypothetical protein ARHIZOSPH14_31810 [Agromyces rhizosphaerae]